MSTELPEEKPYPGETCPAPFFSHEKVLLAHGGGGKLTHQLIDAVFQPAFKNTQLETQHDGAVIDFPATKLVMTTDSYVVNPLVFPGGDIGSLAVNGTINDLAMCGARPRYLTVGFILEEGLPIATLQTVVHSMKLAAQKNGVCIVTGDTKVVAKGNGDGIYINTAGVGEAHPVLRVHPDRIRPGDSILLSSDLARHGIAVLSAREGLEFQTPILSDCASVFPTVQNLLDSGIQVHCLRDLTRGGLATALIEIANTSNLTFKIEESAVVIQEPVRGACELLGFDPFYIANEGCFVAFVSPDDAQRTLEIMQQYQGEGKASIIGTVEQTNENGVILKTTVGSSRALDMLSGDQLPRIC